MLQEVLLDGEIERRTRIGAAIRSLANHGLANVPKPFPVLLVRPELPQDRGPKPQQLRFACVAPLVSRAQTFD